MLKIFSRWILLVFLLETSTAQFSNCGYIYNIISKGEIYFITSPGYPSQNYPPGIQCRWTIRSEISFSMICNIEWIPISKDCSTDALSVQLGYYVPRRYCGYQNLLNVTTNSGIHEMSVTLTSSSSSTGGKFLCTIKSFDDVGIYKECGRQNALGMIGSNKAGFNEYTMMAGIIDVRNEKLFCGATIINDYQVLTAAHCVADKSIDELSIRVGDHDLSTNFKAQAMRQFRLKNVQIHRTYSPRNLNDDIAIITIDGIIEFNKFVGAICLPFQSLEKKLEGQIVETIGWGTKSLSRPLSDYPVKAKLRIMTREDQIRKFPNIGIRQMGTLMNRTDSCQSDSGGPIFFRNPKTNRLVLIGIISYGGICGDGEPRINIRVGAYINWIEQRNDRNFSYFKEE